jgi:hypothetical protein
LPHLAPFFGKLLNCKRRTDEQAIALLRADKANQPFQLSDDFRKLVGMMEKADILEVDVEVKNEEFFGFPTGTRVLSLPTPLMLELIIVQTDGNYKIVWTEPGPGR